MKQKGAPTNTTTEPIDMYKTAAGKANTAAATVPQEWVVPQMEHPTLTTDQKVQLLTLQRNAVVAQNQKFQADQQFEKAMAELNKAYGTVNHHQGFSLNELSLEFVSVKG